MAFTLIFDGDIVGNPFATTTPHGTPNAIAIGNVIERNEELAHRPAGSGTARGAPPVGDNTGDLEPSVSRVRRRSRERAQRDVSFTGSRSARLLRRRERAFDRERVGGVGRRPGHVRRLSDACRAGERASA